ncbi:hypothetical protein LZ199_26255 [Myxococcus sp. QH3KD-4-1]|nr:hypothetical protein [Myxococcus qinghaiensis]
MRTLSPGVVGGRHDGRLAKLGRVGGGVSGGGGLWQQRYAASAGDL